MKNLVALLMLVVSIPVLSEGSDDSKISRVEVTDAGFNIYAKEDQFSSAVCDDGDSSTVNYAISFKQTDFPNGYSHMLSTALAAFMGDKNISMWYSGCQSSPWGVNQTMPKPVTLVVK